MFQHQGNTPASAGVELGMVRSDPDDPTPVVARRRADHHHCLLTREGTQDVGQPQTPLDDRGLRGGVRQRPRPHDRRRRDERAPAGVGDEEPLDGGVDHGAVDVTAVPEPQGHLLAQPGSQPVGEGDLRLLRLSELDDLFIFGDPLRLRELALEILEQGFPSHLSTLVPPCAEAGRSVHRRGRRPGQADPHSGRHGSHVHQPLSNSTKHHYQESSMRMLRSAVVALVALPGAWLLVAWTGLLAGQGLTRVDDVVALGAAVSGTAISAWYGLTAAALLVAELCALSRRTLRLAAGLRTVVRRVGAPVLRRAAVAGVGAGLALGATPAIAGPPTLLTGEAAPSTAPVEDTSWDGVSPGHPVPLDLRPGLTSLPDRSGGSSDAADNPSDLPAPGATPETGVNHPPGSHESRSEHPTDDAATGRPSVPAPVGQVNGAPSPAPMTTGHSEEPGPSAAGPGTPRPGAGGRIPAPPAASPHGVDRPLPPFAAPPAGPTAAETSEEEPAASPSRPRDPATSYVVRPGDTLWGIAQAHLDDATDAEIAAEWPRWHTTNRAVIGADPHLIRPGQVLLAPDPKDAP